MNTTAFIFFDETSTKTDMTRLHGWAPIGERCVDSVPASHRYTNTFIAGLSLKGIIAPMVIDPMVIDGAMNGVAFLTCVKQFVCPELKSGQVVVMDNLRAQKLAAVEEAIRAVGCSTLFTPPYSPDINPIENFFSKLKSYL